MLELQGPGSLYTYIRSLALLLHIYGTLHSHATGCITPSLLPCFALTLCTELKGWSICRSLSDASAKPMPECENVAQADLSVQAGQQQNNLSIAHRRQVVHELKH